MKRLDAKSAAVFNSQPLKLQIPEKKDYNKMFHRYLPQEVYERIYPPAPPPPPPKIVTPIKPSRIRGELPPFGQTGKAPRP